MMYLDDEERAKKRTQILKHGLICTGIACFSVGAFLQSFAVGITCVGLAFLLYGIVWHAGTS